MDTFLLLLTTASLAIALGMSAVAWTLYRRERERSDARVAALEVAVDEGGTTRRFTDPLDEFGPAPGPLEPTRPVEVGAAPAGALFASAAREDTGSMRRWVPAVAGGAIGIALLTIALSTGGNGSTASAEPKAPAPLELLALQHRQQDKRFEVSGIVRNPAGARPVERLNAVVFFFDDRGGFLTSARAPVDFQTLSGGEDSPFTVVATSAPAGMARYRVSFRRDSSGMMPHVDRRERQ